MSPELREGTPFALTDTDDVGPRLTDHPGYYGMSGTDALKQSWNFPQCEEARNGESSVT